MKFTKILIANRGEIACRIMGTAHKMGIACVALYSHLDRNALHVEMADESIFLPGSTLHDTYLNIDAVVEAARSTGCQAIHPGYGFLSENAHFARAVADAGLILIGPPPSAMEAMGDKITSKAIAIEAGVSTIPGTKEAVDSAEAALEAANAIGYPVMIKAAAGGGGKGMRVAYSDAEVSEGFDRATSEAQSSFGDGRVFVEKFIENPRHIEIQLLGDAHGNVVYVGERECSLQRRHQKVIEEAPSPFVTPEMRRAMGEQAVALARAVGYQSAGTVEFIAGADHSFYFLEMNTRLQVEHPITEMTSGLDLVCEMILIAQGEPLSIIQDQMGPRGHAIEARIYAEDSARGFLPSSGRLAKFLTPGLREGAVRLDTGVEEGGEISTSYDPMIAKLIGAGATREEARTNLLTALDQFYVEGVSTNIPFLSHLLASDDFQCASMTTAYIDTHYAHGFEATAPESLELPLAVAAVIDVIVQGAEEERAILLNRTAYPFDVDREGERYEVHLPQGSVVVETYWRCGSPLFEGIFNGHYMCFQLRRVGLSYEIMWGGFKVMTQVMTRRAADLYLRIPEKMAPDLSNMVMAPMPGLVVNVMVAQGQAIKAGQPVAIIEAMKMENVIHAGKDGTIDLLVTKGENVSVDQPLARIA